MDLERSQDQTSRVRSSLDSEDHISIYQGAIASADAFYNLIHFEAPTWGTRQAAKPGLEESVAKLFRSFANIKFIPIYKVTIAIVNVKDYGYEEINFGTFPVPLQTGLGKLS